MFDRESKRGQRVIKAVDLQMSRMLGRGFKDGENVGGGAESNIPDGEFSRGGYATGEMKLFDVKLPGFFNRADDGMESFVFSDGTNAVDAIGQADEFVGE